MDDLSQIGKNSDVYPEFTALKASIGQEADDFIEEVFFNDDGRVQTLLGADYTVVDGDLADLYGVKSRGSGRTDLSGTGRVGILNQSAFLSVYAKEDETAPVLRGAAVLDRVLCQEQTLPSELDIQIVPPAPDPTKTTRERFADHSADPECFQCHQDLDAIGFSFENF